MMFIRDTTMRYVAEDSAMNQGPSVAKTSSAAMKSP